MILRLTTITTFTLFALLSQYNYYSINYDQSINRNYTNSQIEVDIRFDTVDEKKQKIIPFIFNKRSYLGPYNISISVDSEITNLHVKKIEYIYQDITKEIAIDKIITYSKHKSDLYIISKNFNIPWETDSTLKIKLFIESSSNNSIYEIIEIFKLNHEKSYGNYYIDVLMSV